MTLPTPLPTLRSPFQRPSRRYANAPANAFQRPCQRLFPNPLQSPSVGSALTRAFHPASDLRSAGAPLTSKASRQTIAKPAGTLIARACPSISPRTEGPARAAVRTHTHAREAEKRVGGTRSAIMPSNRRADRDTLARNRLAPVDYHTLPTQPDKQSQVLNNSYLFRVDPVIENDGRKARARAKCQTRDQKTPGGVGWGRTAAARSIFDLLRIFRGSPEKTVAEI